MFPLRDVVRRLQVAAEVVRRGSVVDALFFDPSAYARDNRDVAQSIEAGKVRSSYDHYVRYGKWEGRRFSQRRFGLSEQASLRLLRLAADLERGLDRLACQARYGELGHRLRRSDGAMLSRPIGPWKDTLDRGPWRVALPSSFHGGGWYMLRVKVAPVRAPLAFRPLDRHGQTLGAEAVALFCKPTRAVQRLIRIPSGSAAIEIELLDQRLRSQPHRLGLRPVTEDGLQGKMMRRVRHHHPSYVGRSEQGIREALARQARLLALAYGEVLRAAYESTFPPPVRRSGYRDWIEQIEAPHLRAIEGDLEARLDALRAGPLISVLVPVHDPDERHLRSCIDSVRRQSYPNWELCLVDDASHSRAIRRVLTEEAARDERIRVVLRRDNGHICRASNDALAMARGELLALLDHDDELSPHALLQVAEAYREHPEAVVIYSDEDKLSEDGERVEPHFKPEIDPDLLLGQNYVGHLLVARSDRVRAVAGFRVGYEGSQDHDLLLRLTEGLRADQVRHIPWVLYHWRMSPSSTAASADAKPYSAQAGIAAVRDALARRDLAATVEHAEISHCYRVLPALPSRAPSVSVIVATRDACTLLTRCLDTLLAKTDYPDFEVLVVDNGSREAAVLRYLEQVGADPRVSVLRDDRPFNFSALNNSAVERARGDLVCLLNNDTEVIDGDWLRKLVAQAVRPEIGCAGAKLLYPDDTIQHAGVLLGLHGLAGHPYRLMSRHHPGYFGRLTVAHAVSAVTAACLVVERRIYRQVGGLDDRLAVAFNDVDFCLKVRKLGLRNLLVPHAVLLHHESASRGLDQNAAQRQRFLAEVALVKERWREAIYADPCYSPHLSLDYDDYSLRSG